MGKIYSEEVMSNCVKKVGSVESLVMVRKWLTHVSRQDAG